MPPPQLPTGFAFGAATAALQVEGALAEDGRGPSIWESFAARPLVIADASTPETGAGSYHRTTEDIALLRELGVDSYRFSLSWPRLLPQGRGRVNQAGFDHYDRLIDDLLEAGIDPMVTLYHFDLPQALEDDGGWRNRSTVEAMAEYAALAGEKYADRVKHWVPISEPNVIAMLGYGIGEHAPGRKLFFDVLPVTHHLLLAHGRAAIELRNAGATSVGCANNHAPMWPASDDEADVGATKLFDALWNGMFLEPILLGRYPADLAPLLDDVVEPGDMATIRQPLDFYGVNYYSPIRVAAGDEGSDMPFRFVPLLGRTRTASGWSVVPTALREWLVLFRARFRAALPPIVITESGSSWVEEVDADGIVHDKERSEYLEAHLEAVAEAVHRGVDVQAYYAWSLLDSWEWAHGLTTPYGLVHVDRTTLTRTPKDSFRTYQRLIRELRAPASAE
ncbi:GH1 family beta-glucosidase [Nocardioides sp. Kera G14]|uniref:GH1 family beta-glucosidase n=1 Tax=Nocardioides sp. Kera G14 TaxID=2884264 RepID=UPI001D1228A7|nr:GH1 family beta-glucosidase [Nocardioides sp. Kera G14]UDY23515.1 beta-glucosidase [Nocardioides sp. Kera G14]